MGERVVGWVGGWVGGWVCLRLFVSLCLSVCACVGDERHLQCAYVRVPICMRKGLSDKVCVRVWGRNS